MELMDNYFEMQKKNTGKKIEFVKPVLCQMVSRGFVPSQLQGIVAEREF